MFERLRLLAAERYEQWLESLRQVWVNRRVWFRVNGITYEGFVSDIDGDGEVWVLYGYDAQNQPLYSTLPANEIPSLLVLAEA